MYYTDIRTTARLLDLSPSAIYARIRRGQMPYLLFSKHYLIKLQEIAAELGLTEAGLITLMQRQKLPIWFCQ